MSPSTCYLFMVLLPTLCRDQVSVAAEDEEPEAEKRAWACYGNYHNFLDINCPPDHEVELLSMMNGAKPASQNCPFMTTVEDNFRQECCTFEKGDCVIETHPNNFPVECSKRHFCNPQSRLANTGPQCNSNVFPKFTHYTEITYRCVSPTLKATVKWPPTMTTDLPDSLDGLTLYPRNTSIILAVTTATISPTNVSTAFIVDDNTTTTTISSARIVTPHGTQRIVVEEVVESDNFTPAMVGGMIAGIVGLMLTIFIFMFYWGRKKQVRISGKPSQNSVWDFLLTNTMSVRAFRGYDNFSSSSVQGRHTVCVSSEDDCSTAIGGDGGSGGSGRTTEKKQKVWLPNISVDSGQGESNLTSDDNCSVVTLERASATYGSFRSQRGSPQRASDGASSGVALVVNRL